MLHVIWGVAVTQRTLVITKLTRTYLDSVFLIYFNSVKKRDSRVSIYLGFD